MQPVILQLNDEPKQSIKTIVDSSSLNVSSLTTHAYNLRLRRRRKFKFEVYSPSMNSDASDQGDACTLVDMPQNDNLMLVTSIQPKNKSRSKCSSTLELRPSAFVDAKCSKDDCVSQSSHETIFQDSCCCS